MISEEALKEISACQAGKDAVEGLRVKYLGRKGIITELFKRYTRPKESLNLVPATNLCEVAAYSLYKVTLPCAFASICGPVVAGTVVLAVTFSTTTE